VLTARKIQQKRFEKLDKIHCNAQMPGKMVREVCRLDTHRNSHLEKGNG
jgi:magnesium chelatase family protein